MMYIVKVRWYNEFSDKEDKMEETNCFVPGDNFHDIIDKMEAYYGKNEIEKITIEIFSPDNFLEFNNSLHDCDLFRAIRETLEPRIIW